MQDTLNARFAAPLPPYYRRRVIVWMDEAGEFASQAAELRLDTARVLIMRPDRLFELRRQIERDCADENILLYCPLSFKRAEDNWLLDVFLYGEEFRADYWSLVFEELGIANTPELRDYAKGVKAFFASKERRARLKALGIGCTGPQELRTCMMSVVCGLKEADLNGVTRAVLSDNNGGEGGLLPQIDKFCGEGAFWQAVRDEYGYNGVPEAQALCAYLLFSAASINAGEGLLSGLPHSAAHAPRAYAFFLSWLAADRKGLLEAVQRAEGMYRIADRLMAADIKDISKQAVLQAADHRLLSEALRAFARDGLDPDEAEALARGRQDKPWYSVFAPYYEALGALAGMRRFYLAHRGGFHEDTPQRLWRDYANELYRMDSHYRTLCNAYEAALSAGLITLEDELKAAAEAAERLYKNWFLKELNGRWSGMLSETTLEDALPDTDKQLGFYSKYIRAQDARVFVIISDGLRYEAGSELADQLTAALSGNTALSSMAAAIPTITSVGMAALLPHRTLRLEDDLRIRSDGLSTEAGNRGAVLAAACPQSLAIGFKELRLMNRAQRQEALRGAKVVYIYHNSIDSAGENGGNVMKASYEGIGEIVQMARILVNELSATAIYITADHGFLYTRSALEEYEKADKELIDGELLEYKRRHAIARLKSAGSQTLAMPLGHLGREDLSAVFPRGSMRFKLQGAYTGYMHGGLSLQELMVPLIRYQNKKAGQKGFTAVSKPEIMVLGNDRRVNNNIFTLSFFQKDICEGKVQPRRVLIRMEDAAGQAVSDEHVFVFDSAARENNDRVSKVTFHLLGSGFDRHAPYYLTLTDADDKAVLERAQYTIDIAFGLDFEF